MKYCTFKIQLYFVSSLFCYFLSRKTQTGQAFVVSENDTFTLLEREDFFFFCQLLAFHKLTDSIVCNLILKLAGLNPSVYKLLLSVCKILWENGPKHLLMLQQIVIVILIKAACKHLIYQMSEGHHLLPKGSMNERVLAFST